MIRLNLVAPALAVLLLGACATQPDPYEVCSADWIEVRSQKAMKEFKRDIRGPLKTLRSAADKAEGNGKISAFTALRVTNALNTLVNRLENSQALDDLALLQESCDDPDVMENAISDFLEREGAPESVISILKNMTDFRDLRDAPATQEISSDQ